MEFRIESVVEGTRTIVVVAGRLAEAGAEELRRACRSSDKPLLLDVSSLVSTDADGGEVLRSLIREGVELRGASPFLRLLLEDELFHEMNPKDDEPRSPEEMDNS